MSSSDSGVNDIPTGFNDEATSSDGYGGLAPYLYDAIVAFKKFSTYPDFCDLKENRNAYFHWRTRCKNFTVTETGVLLYSGNNSSTARAVVRTGEVRLAIRFIHEKIGHAGQRQTNLICARRLYWRSMHRDIARFVSECDFCLKRKYIRKKDLQLSQIASPPSIVCPSSRSEDIEMHELADRLLLNNEDSLGGVLQEYYRAAEPFSYEIYEDDGPFHQLLDEDEERAVANTLSTMNGGGTYVVLRQPMKMNPSPHSSSALVYDVEDSSMSPMIVADDVIPAVSNEIVTTMMSPSCKLETLPSTSDGLRLEDEEGLMEERDREEGMMEGTPLRRGGGEGGSARKRRMMDPPLDGLMRAGTTNSTKKRLIEENQALRARLHMLESIHSEDRTNVAMLMPPVDDETAAMQKNLLIIQREVLVLQRTYWQAKLQTEGFDVQLGDYYDAAAAGMEEVEEQEGHIHHYGEEEGVEMEERRGIEEETTMGGVH